ncbi:MAG: hypothetical protein JWM28_4511 [Chitinophagaceae bacterium]|nr:hypothetical protein [Chitinophagaceae bacterium]
MKKLLFSFLLLFVTTSLVFAQDEEKKEEVKKGFKKENLFTGGSISLSFGTGSFLVGASPVLGYSMTNWLDAGIVVNYTYQSYRDVDFYGNGSNDKIKQSIYGGGGFVKIYPVHFLFAQAQFEHNFVSQKYIYGSGLGTVKSNYDVNSMLVGAGYSSGRNGSGGQPHFYLAVLFDISGNKFSPYVGNTGNAIPVIRAGIQVPLFQGKNRNNYEEEDRGNGGGGKKPRNYNRY